MVRNPKWAELPMVLQLRDAIRQDGRTLAELAEASGVDPSRLSRFVRGQRDLTFNAAVRLCDALGIRLVLPRRSRKKK
jgi:transcriptional regulator with XRE-family HTH domain